MAQFFKDGSKRLPSGNHFEDFILAREHHIGFFTLINLGVGAKPLDDRTAFIPERNGTNEKPAILSVKTPNAGLCIKGRSRHSDVRPILNKSAYFVEVDRVAPTPTASRFLGKPGIIKPLLIAEDVVTICSSAPSLYRQRVNDGAELDFRRLHFFASLFQI